MKTRSINVQRNIMEVIEERRLTCLAHFKGPGLTEFQNMILEWSTEGRRRKRKSREQWTDGVGRRRQQTDNRGKCKGHGFGLKDAYCIVEKSLMIKKY